MEELIRIYYLMCVCVILHFSQVWLTLAYITAKNELLIKINILLVNTVAWNSMNFNLVCQLSCMMLLRHNVH